MDTVASAMVVPAADHVLVLEQEQVSTTPAEGAASPPRGMVRGSFPRNGVNSGDGEL